MSNKSVKLTSYIEEIDSWLPYPKEKKKQLLENLREEVGEAIQDTGNFNPVIAYGDPYQIAKALSLSQDWGIKPAGWGIRTFAFMIDIILIVGCCLAYLIFGLIVIFRIDLNQALTINTLGEAFDQLRSDLDLGVFLILAILLLFYALGAALIYSAYFVILEKVYSTTIGKRILGLLVVDKSGIRLTWKQVILRNFTKFPGVAEFLVFDIILGMLKTESGQGEYQRATEILAEAIVVRNT
jgi:uncharacterized RDD family membrane protein YckC